jgi:hypothetical protein
MPTAMGTRTRNTRRPNAPIGPTSTGIAGVSNQPATKPSAGGRTTTATVVDRAVSVTDSARSIRADQVGVEVRETATRGQGDDEHAQRDRWRRFEHADQR